LVCAINIAARACTLRRVKQPDIPSVTTHSLFGAPRGLRGRLREAARRRVKQWAYGDEVNFPGDPRRRLIVDSTTTADVGLVQFHDNDGEPVTVGRYTGLHHSVRIFHGGMHRSEWVGVLHVHRTGEQGQWVWPEGAMNSRGPVVIGSDVLVGFEALIMSGVTIGDGAIVTPRAVVLKDVEPFSIVGGNPAKHIKWRFDEPTREALLRIRWWDWPDEKIRQHRSEIDSPDVAGFIARHDPVLTGKQSD
jgi:acetyltransferase-like isoleucine patch superfamily enzyme